MNGNRSTSVLVAALALVGGMNGPAALAQPSASKQKNLRRRRQDRASAGRLNPDPVGLLQAQDDHPRQGSLHAGRKERLSLLQEVIRAAGRLRP